MKQNLFLLLLTVFAFINFSYSKPPKLPKPKRGAEWVEPERKVDKNIFGNWIWLSTDCCGIRHGITNPANTSDDIELEINNNNTFLEVHSKKNTLPRSGSFTQFQQNAQDMIQFNDERPAQYFLSAKGDTLTLSWKYLELQTEKYLKKK